LVLDKLKLAEAIGLSLAQHTGMSPITCDVIS
jgi:hypothetical protein